MSEQPQPPGSYPEQPQQFAPPPQPATPPKKSGGKVLGIVGAIAALLVVAALKFGVASAIGGLFDDDKTAEAKVGDCIGQLPEVTEGAETEANNAEVVKCDSTDAAYTVVGRVNDQTEAQARTGEACEPFFKEGDDGYFFYAVQPGGKGYLLCLNKKA